MNPRTAAAHSLLHPACAPTPHDRRCADQPETSRWAHGTTASCPAGYFAAVIYVMVIMTLYNIQVPASTSCRVTDACTVPRFKRAGAHAATRRARRAADA